MARDDAKEKKSEQDRGRVGDISSMAVEDGKGNVRRKFQSVIDCQLVVGRRKRRGTVCWFSSWIREVLANKRRNMLVT